MVVRAPRKPSKCGFYARALSAAEQLELQEASQVEGIDEEIAALRVRLRQAMADGEDDLPLVLRGLDILRRLVATRYGLSKEDERALDTAFARETQRRIRERGEGGETNDAA